MKLSDYLTERKDRIVPDESDLIHKRVNKISFSGVIYISNSKKSKTNMIIVKPNDFLVSGINASKGALAINTTGETLCATVHYSSYAVDNSKVDLNFFKVFIRSDYFTKRLKEMVKGGIKTELKPKKILDMDITLPSLEEQRKIISDYKTQKKLLSNDYFHNFNAKHFRHIKEQLYDQILFDGMIIDPSNPNEKVPNKKTVNLMDIIKDGPKNGYSPKPVNTPTTNKVLSLSATTSEVFKEEETKYFDESVSDEFTVRPGDVFIQRGNSREYVGVSAACLVTPQNKVVYPDLMMRLRTNEKVLPEYLVYILNSGNVRNYFRRKAKGTVDTMVKINQTTLKTLHLPVPDISEQEKSIIKIGKIKEELNNLEESVKLVIAKTESAIAAYFEKKFQESLND